MQNVTNKIILPKPDAIMRTATEPPRTHTIENMPHIKNTRFPVTKTEILPPIFIGIFPTNFICRRTK